MMASNPYFLWLLFSCGAGFGWLLWDWRGYGQRCFAAQAERVKNAIYECAWSPRAMPVAFHSPITCMHYLFDLRVESVFLLPLPWLHRADGRGCAPCWFCACCWSRPAVGLGQGRADVGIKQGIGNREQNGANDGC